MITLEENNGFLMAVADWNFPENRIISQENQELINQAVENLPEMLKQTAQLYIFDHLPPKEIAKLLNCPPGTVKSRTFRIKRYLSEVLKEK